MSLDMTTGSVASDEYLREVVKKWSAEQNRGRLYAICCWNGSHAKFVRSLLTSLPHGVQAIGSERLRLANCAHVLISAGSADFWRGRDFAEALLVRAGGHWELQKAVPASTTLKGHVPEESLQKLKEEWAKQMANGTTRRIPIVVNPDVPPNQAASSESLTSSSSASGSFETFLIRPDDKLDETFVKNVDVVTIAMRLDEALSARIGEELGKRGFSLTDVIDVRIPSWDSGVGAKFVQVTAKPRLKAETFSEGFVKVEGESVRDEEIYARKEAVKKIGFYDGVLGKPFALQASTWETKHDPRMGAYKERIVEKHRGGCFECSAPIDGPARERQRGGTVWHLHAVCPEPPKKARKR